MKATRDASPQARHHVNRFDRAPRITPEQQIWAARSVRALTHICIDGFRDQFGNLGVEGHPSAGTSDSHSETSGVCSLPWGVMKITPNGVGWTFAPDTFSSDP